jgi:hypothetical protein
MSAPLESESGDAGIRRLRMNVLQMFFDLSPVEVEMAIKNGESPDMLDIFEDGLRRMIRGVFWFPFIYLPRQLLVYLPRQLLVLLGRMVPVALKISRIMFLGLIWALIVVGPLAWILIIIRTYEYF